MTWDNRISSVAYVILKDKCIFTACQKSSQGSTINYAEDIIEAIAKLEKHDPRSFRYFDIQTRISYGEDDLLRPNEGSFIFDEVMNWWEGTWWRTTVCPTHVSELFQEYIDGVPQQTLLPSWGARKILDF
jgi:hypothetical protein